MVSKRSGDNINLLNSSIKSVSGTLVSTTLYVTSGIVYAFVTSPAVAGTFLFISILVGLLMRPIGGVSQALHKIGSENGESVNSYFSITLYSTILYILLFSVVLFILSDLVASYSIYESELYIYMIAISVRSAIAFISDSVLSASGYPGYVTWLNGTVDFVRISALVLLSSSITSVSDLILVSAGIKIILLVPFLLYLGKMPCIPDKREVSRIWSYARWSVPDQIVDKLSYNMPVYVLGFVSTPAAVGVYEAADRFADFGATVSWNLSSPLLTKVSGVWSVNKESAHEYLDSAVTGGTGFTFVVFGYIITMTDILSKIAFSGQEYIFSTTIIIVGGVNILRGIWTLLSHALEGINRPSASLATKLFGLIISVPVTIYLGSTIGAIGGAIGYGIMNSVIFSYTIWYSHRHFGRIVYDWSLLTRFIVATFSSSILTYGASIFLKSTQLELTYIAVICSLVCAISYGISLYIISEKARRVFTRVLDMAISLTGD